MNERNFLQLVMAGQHGLPYAGDNIRDLLSMFPLCQESDRLFEPSIGSYNMLDELATLRTFRSQCYNKCAGTNKQEIGDIMPHDGTFPLNLLDDFIPFTEI